MKIGENIRKYRTKRHLTQEKLAERIGVSGQAVSKWETNEGLPDTALLPDIADALGVSLDMLFGRKTVTREAMGQCVFDYLRGGGVSENEERLSELLRVAANTFTAGWWTKKGGDDVPERYFREEEGGILWHQSDTAAGMFASGTMFPFAAFFREPEGGFASLLTEETVDYLASLGDRDVMRCLVRLLGGKGRLVEMSVLLREAGVDLAKEEEIFEKMRVFAPLLFCRQMKIEGKRWWMIDYRGGAQEVETVSLLTVLGGAYTATVASEAAQRPSGIGRSKTIL